MALTEYVSSKCSGNRFVRWRQAGVWDQIMDALAAGHDAAVQMIDTNPVHVSCSRFGCFAMKLPAYAGCAARHRRARDRVTESAGAWPLSAAIILDAFVQH